MKLIVYNNILGDIVRIGVYTDDNKWVKWLPKKDLNEYVEKSYSVENKTVWGDSMIIQTEQKYYSCERVMFLDIAFMGSQGWEVIEKNKDKQTGVFRVVYEKGWKR